MVATIYVYESIQALKNGDYSLKFNSAELYQSIVDGWVIKEKNGLEFVFPKDTILVVDKGEDTE